MPRSLAPLARILPLLIPLFLAGCGGPGPVEPLDAFLSAAPQDGVAPAHLVGEDDPRPWPMDPWSYRSHRLEGDTLVLGVQYGGGCRVHRFALLVDPVFRESHPVQMSARLAHDADGDLCRALISEELRFDLGPVRRHYQAAYGPGPGELVIVLEGWRITFAFGPSA